MQTINHQFINDTEVSKPVDYAFELVVMLTGFSVLQLPEGRDFHHKTVFATRNPAFWVGAVTSWRFHSSTFSETRSQFTPLPSLSRT